MAAELNEDGRALLRELRDNTRAVENSRVATTRLAQAVEGLSQQLGELADTLQHNAGMAGLLKGLFRR